MKIKVTEFKLDIRRRKEQHNKDVIMKKLRKCCAREIINLHNIIKLRVAAAVIAKHNTHSIEVGR